MFFLVSVSNVFKHRFEIDHPTMSQSPDKAMEDVQIDSDE